MLPLQFVGWVRLDSRSEPAHVGIAVNLLEWDAALLLGGLGQLRRMGGVWQGEEVRVVEGLAVFDECMSTKVTAMKIAHVFRADSTLGVVYQTLAQKVQTVCACCGEEVAQRCLRELPYGDVVWELRVALVTVSMLAAVCVYTYGEGELCQDD